MTLHKEYYHIEGNKYIKFYVTFNKQSFNLSYEPKKIGYQVTVVPVERGEFFESSGAFTGFNDCLLETGRQSAKRLAEALKILDERKEKYLEFFGIKSELKA